MPRKKIQSRKIIPQTIRAKVFDETGGRCAHCGKPMYFSGNFTVDHIVPLAKGGKNEIENYVPLCFSCNKEKSDDVIDPVDYYTYLPKERLEEAQKYFEKYIRDVDWISNTNLFSRDRFDLIVTVLMDIKNGRMTVPTTIEIAKMKPKEIINFLDRYKQTLPEEDTKILYDKSTLDTAKLTFYRVTNKGKTAFVFDAGIEKFEFDDMEEFDLQPDGEGKLIRMGIYIDPDIEHKKRTALIIASMIKGIMIEIEKAIYSKEKDLEGMLYRIVCLQHDEIADEVVSMFGSKAGTYTLVDENGYPSDDAKIPVRDVPVIFFKDNAKISRIERTGDDDTINRYTKLTIDHATEALEGRMGNAYNKTAYPKRHQ